MVKCVCTCNTKYLDIKRTCSTANLLVDSQVKFDWSFLRRPSSKLAAVVGLDWCSRRCYWSWPFGPSDDTPPPPPSNPLHPIVNLQIIQPRPPPPILPRLFSLSQLPQYIHRKVINKTKHIPPPVPVQQIVSYSETSSSTMSACSAHTRFWQRFKFTC